MDAQLRVFEFKTKDGDNDITRYAVQQMTDRGFRTLTIKVGIDFKNTVFDMIFVIQIVIVAVLLIKGLWLLIKNFDDVVKTIQENEKRNK